MGTISFDTPAWLALIQSSLILLTLLVIMIRLGRRLEPSPRMVRFGLWALVVIQLGAWMTLFIHGFRPGSGPLNDLLLPPHNQVILIRMIHGLVNIFSGWIAAGALFLILWWWYRQILRGSFFQPADLVLLTIGAAAVGWPATLVFLGCVFGLTVIGISAMVIVRKRQLSDRLVITPFIIPAAILTLVIGPGILNLTHLIGIRF